MKKFFLILLCLGFLQAYERNNIFVGVGVGVLDDITSYKVGDKKHYNHQFAPSWGLQGGYEHRPLYLLGIRAYLQSLMDLKPAGLETSITTQLSLNLDLLTNFLRFSQERALGIYAGIGFGFAQEQKTIVDELKDRVYALFLINVGMQYTIDDNNHVQLGVKIPFALTDINNNPLHVTASYIYSF